MKTVLKLALAALAFSGGAALAQDINGQWARGDGNAKVQIAPCGSDTCAINTWIKPGTPKEKTGDKLVMSIKPTSDGEYSGTAFDPQRDLTYKLTVSVKGDSMTTKGCVLAGIVCKGVSWTRIN
ncbi:DUF2147 domain-containing protein [Agrobacterium larrymoorei]|uniref:DUF2147 domain-containing protein n=1 Tax=Agrobacterium larrymoorei TaxID=160699 RepID=A0AAF0H9X1_9HYPH|nr:DUF2147 domain-containing protein [Agrobacterium larrymoorei]WHA41912.1 DUF2147 domain-containing protein [Agrobacterium larrymoorei]